MHYSPRSMAHFNVEWSYFCLSVFALLYISCVFSALRINLATLWTQKQQKLIATSCDLKHNIQILQKISIVLNINQKGHKHN